MMAELFNCKRCGKVFPRTHSVLCPTCLEIEDTNVQKIKQFLSSTSPGENITIEVISEKTGVGLKDIFEYVKKRRLIEFASVIVMKCKMCGAPVNDPSHNGVVCAKCRSIVEKAAEDPDGKSESGEYVLKEDKKEQPPAKHRYGFKKDYNF